MVSPDYIPRLQSRLPGMRIPEAVCLLVLSVLCALCERTVSSLYADEPTRPASAPTVGRIAWRPGRGGSGSSSDRQASRRWSGEIWGQVKSGDTIQINSEKVFQKSGDTIQINSEKVFCRWLPRRMTWCWQLGTTTRASLAMIESYHHAAAWQRKLICMVSPDYPDYGPVWCPQITPDYGVPRLPRNAYS